MKYPVSVRTLIVLLCMASCHRRGGAGTNYSTAITVVVDETDSTPMVPQHPNAILKLYDFEHHPDQSAVLKVAVINDRQTSPILQTHLDDGSTTEERNTGDTRNRIRLIQSFQAKAGQLLTTGLDRFKATEAAHYSECWTTIFRQLSLLSAGPYTTRVCIIYSDLQENARFNSYQNPDLVHDDPEQVIRILSRQAYMPRSLKGVTVIFIHTPATRDADALYIDWCQLYAIELERLGAKAIFTADDSSLSLTNE